MEEFHPRRKMANVYFLVLAALQTIREISNTFGVPTILIPLSIVVLIDAVFAILEARVFTFLLLAFLSRIVLREYRDQGR